tara:strand:+ start:1130 stop:1309 length:180 start_codon:yes stop_codon:yes gene_type:complete
MKYNNKSIKLNRDKYKTDFNKLLEFFLSKKPCYWDRCPIEASSVLSELREIEKGLKNNV